MVGRFDLVLRRSRRHLLTAGKALLVSSLLAGCSSVPDAINPVEWYKGATDLVLGRDRADVPASTPPKGEYPDVGKTPADTRKDIAKALPADRSNAKYAEPVRREGAPTKPLARRAPAAADTQVAAAPQAAIPAKPAVTKQELALAPTPAAPAQVAAAQPAPAGRTVTVDSPRLSPDRRAPTVRDEGPSAPPASIAMNPPARADIPETVAVPTKGKVKPVQEQFQRRLAESAQQTVYPGMVEMPQPALARTAEEEPIHLVPPSSRRAAKGGGKGLAAPAPEPMPAASFQVASVDFRSGSADLTSTDRQSIAEVARLYKQTGGIVRIVGYAPAPAFGQADAVQKMMGGLDASMKRANAVAHELAKRGVPASKIMVGADPSAAMGDAGAQVYLDVV